MNSRTAKLIRQYSRITNLIPSRILKSFWNLTPRNQRRLARLKMQSQILAKLNETFQRANTETKVPRPQPANQGQASHGSND